MYDNVSGGNQTFEVYGVSSFPNSSYSVPNYSVKFTEDKYVRGYNQDPEPSWSSSLSTLTESSTTRTFSGPLGAITLPPHTTYWRKAEYAVSQVSQV